MNGSDFNRIERRTERASIERKISRRCKKGGGRLPEPGPRTVERYYIKNINQQVSSAGSPERRGQETGAGESTQKLETVRENAEEAPVRGLWGKPGAEGGHLL